MVRSDYAPFYLKRPAFFSVNWNLTILHYIISWLTINDKSKNNYNNEQKENVNITRYGYAVNGGTGCR